MVDLGKVKGCGFRNWGYGFIGFWCLSLGSIVYRA